MTLAQAWCAQIAQIEDRAAQCFNLFVQYLGSSSTTPSSKFIPKLGSLNDLDQHGPPEKMALSDDDAQQLGHFLKSEADPVAVPTVEYLLQHESRRIYQFLFLVFIAIVVIMIYVWHRYGRDLMCAVSAQQRPQAPSTPSIPIMRSSASKTIPSIPTHRAKRV